jgi:glucose/arabinose dehydrogenase
VFLQILSPARAGSRRSGQPRASGSRTTLRTVKALLSALGAIVVLAAVVSGSGVSGSDTNGTMAAAAADMATTTDPETTSVDLSVSPANATAPFDVPRAVQVPPGWNASVWARVPHARYEVWTPEGALLVSQPDNGTVSLLSPGSAPGAVPQQRVLLAGLTQPQGMAFDTGGRRVMYVVESDRLDRYPWSAGGPGPRTTVVDHLPDLQPGGDDVHRQKSIVVGPDHTLYIPLPSSTNAGLADERMDPPRGTVATVDPDTGALRIFARGIRNGEGLSFAPDGSLWVAVNNRDNIAYPFHRAYGGRPDAFAEIIQGYVTDHPPEELARLTPGHDLGWPVCNPDPDVDPGVAGTALDEADPPYTPDAQSNPDSTVRSCTGLKPIERGVPAHSAPLGLHFLPAGTLGVDRGEGAVLALHGSWNAQPPRAPEVVWVPWNAAATSLGAPQTIFGGFQDATGARWGRPVDNVIGPDSALYVSDDVSGTIYRVTPRAN